MVDNRPEFTVHNFDAVNQYVASMAERHRTSVTAKKADIFSVYAKHGSILLVAVGITAALIFWGYWLLKKKPEAKVITTEKIIERPIKIEPKIYVTGVGAQSPANEVRSAAEGRVASLAQSSSASADGQISNVTPIYNFNIFKQVPFNRDGIDEVVIGMKYDDSESKAPSSQWCYILSLNLDGTATRMTLAHKTKSYGKTKQHLTFAQASKLGTKLSTLRSAQKLCVFE